MEPWQQTIKPTKTNYKSFKSEASNAGISVLDLCWTHAGELWAE